MNAVTHGVTSRASLGEQVEAARARTLALVSGLAPEQLLGPRLKIVNPPLWEVGHVGWFQEHWCLRRGERSVRPLIANADALYDSATVAHDTRWDLPLPDLRETLRYLERVKDEVLARLAHDDADDGLRYFVALATLHEEMHCEAFTYTRQTLGYAPPRASMPGAADAAGPWPGDVEVAGGTFVMGASRSVSAFVFDNEKWAHEVEVAPFRIARAPVTNSEFAAFVEDGGYRERRFWSAEGWHWREQAGAAGPVYWRREGARWLERTYERYEALRPHVPVIHVSWHEAQAYCRWAGRRLPTEAEWEFAAATAPGAIAARRRFPWGDAMPDARRANLCGGPAARVEVAACEAGDSAWGCRQMIGNVWEWTADWFQPYPGFSPDPYKEYSAPWFGDHKVLRGGCHATRDIVVHNGFRNFYTPDRRDVYAGFRTCAA